MKDLANDTAISHRVAAPVFTTKRSVTHRRGNDADLRRAIVTTQITEIANVDEMKTTIDNREKEMKETRRGVELISGQI